MNACDHVLGLHVDPYGDALLLQQSRREAIARLDYEHVQDWIAGGTGVPWAVAEARKLDTPEKALADHLDAFTYCPRCGSRLVPP